MNAPVSPHAYGFCAAAFHSETSSCWGKFAFIENKKSAVFDLIRRHGALASAVHCAFDLLELDGRDLRREPIEKRKELLARLFHARAVSSVPFDAVSSPAMADLSEA
jgi:ATP-dependent DNA ligase